MLFITVSGTRTTTDGEGDRYRALFERWLAPFLVGDCLVHVGGAVGIDTLALRWLTTREHVAIRVVVPRSVADQPAPAREAIAAATLLPRVSVVELAAPALGTAAYHDRNRWMVDRSEFVVGFPQGDDRRSGTWQTLDYAHSLQRPYLVVRL